MSRITSKLDNRNILSQHPLIAPHLPDTVPLRFSNLQHMLQRYSMLYLKPDNSCQGKGIIRIDRLANNKLKLRTRDDQTTSYHTNILSLWRNILRKKRKRPYLIQQGINSLTKNQRLFDIRVHLFRIHGNWVIGGIIGRIATQNGIATNAYSGGQPKEIMALLREDLGLSWEQQKRTIHDLCQLSLIATEWISRIHPKWSEFGLDIGIDRNGHYWLYEINIKPGLYVFRYEKELLAKLRQMRKKAS